MNYFLYIYYEEGYFSEDISVFCLPLLITRSLNLFAFYYLFQVENLEGKELSLVHQCISNPL